MILRGVVRSGKGDFAHWLEKLEEHYTRKTGMRLFPGTLNVHLIGQTYPTPQGCLRLEKEEYAGTVTVSIVPCTVFGRRAFILRTDTDTGKLGDAPDAILEIAADVKLREVYGLHDGDELEVDVPDSPFEPRLEGGPYDRPKGGQMRIRKAFTHEAQAIIDLHADTVRRINSRDYSPAQIEAWLGRRKVEITERMIADAEYYVAIDEQDCLLGIGHMKDCCITGLYVSACCQGAGAGSALLAQMEAAAIADGAKERQ